MREGAALYEAKQYPQAIKIYASLPVRFPQSKFVSAAHLAAGKSAYLAGDFGTVRAQLGPISEAGGPDGVEAAHWLVRSLLKQQKPADALAAAEKGARQGGQRSLRRRLGARSGRCTLRFARPP